ncbi:MAG: hypothetical protein HYS33_02255 [Acidobacteria bacterium]|nr:hypothetical protein [Acidobacteriota bacterium]
MNLDFLAALEEDWKAVSKAERIGWLVFYGLFLVYALASKSGFLVIDHVNLMIHESGHLLFGWFGPTLGLWGGTLLELLVPLALAAYFVFQRHVAGAAFSSFFFFENFLYISVYMADARSQGLPLVTVGDPDAGGHDWFRIFTSLGLLQYDTRIAAVVRLLGWLGMIGTVVWFARYTRATKPSA